MLKHVMNPLDSTESSLLFLGLLMPVALMLGCAQTCNSDEDCEVNEFFCDGRESCVDGICTSSGNPCAQGETCMEDVDRCIPPNECEFSNPCPSGQDCTQFIHPHVCEVGEPDNCCCQFIVDGDIIMEDYLSRDECLNDRFLGICSVVNPLRLTPHPCCPLATGERCGD